MYSVGTVTPQDFRENKKKPTKYWCVVQWNKVYRLFLRENILYPKVNEKTLCVVTIAMICSNLASIGNLNIIGGLYISQSKIYDGAFIAKIVKGHLKSTFAQDSRVLTLPLPLVRPCSFSSKSLFIFCWKCAKKIMDSAKKRKKGCAK